MATALTSSPAAQRLARQMDMEKRRLEAVGVRQTATIGVRARVAAIKAFKAGWSPAHAARHELMRAVPTVAQGMLAAHLQGQITAQQRANKVLGKRRLAFSTAFDHAVRLLKGKAEDMKIDIAGGLFADAADQAMSDLADAMSSKVADAIAEIARLNLHTRGGIDILRSAFDAAGVTVKNPYALETLYRKQIGAAYAAGRLAVNSQPHIAPLIWGYEYTAVMDDRTRPSHAALDGVRKRKDDPFWLKYMPPYDWGCRCSVIEILADDPQLATDSGPYEAPPADEGFAVNPVLELLNH